VISFLHIQYLGVSRVAGFALGFLYSGTKTTRYLLDRRLGGSASSKGTRKVAVPFSHRGSTPDCPALGALAVFLEEQNSVRMCAVSRR
jgi:hypothetical protein